MGLKFGAQVTYRQEQKAKSGTVLRATSKKALVIAHDSQVVLNAPVRCFVESDAQMPSEIASLLELKKFKKGSLVKVVDEDGVLKGRIVSIGMELTVEVGLDTYTCPWGIVYLLKPCEIVKDPENALDSWTIKSEKQIPSHDECACYSYVLNYNGKAVLKAEDNFWNGPMNLESLAKIDGAPAEDKFLADIKNAFEQVGIAKEKMFYGEPACVIQFIRRYRGLKGMKEHFNSPF